jgi:uncharacterized protein (DUF342 family)
VGTQETDAILGTGSPCRWVCEGFSGKNADKSNQVNPPLNSQPTGPAEPPSFTRIVRDGEKLVVGLSDFKPGDGIVQTEEGWAARVPVVGYLEISDGGVGRVSPVVVIDEVGIHAALDLRTARDGEAGVTRAEVDRALTDSGVTDGLNPNRVDAAWRLFDARGSLLRPMRVASGTAPVPGRLASVTYEPDFDPDHSGAVSEAKNGREAEDGSIDFREQDRVANVPMGAQFGVWTPGGESKEGIGLDGSPIDVPASEKSKPLKTGKNVKCEPQGDGTVRLVAMIAGVLEIEKGVPSISEVLLIPGDVDFETGNIDADGSVVIKGSVRKGFRVAARLSLTIEGTVEGADLICGGDLELKKGLIGSETTKVIVGGSLRMKYAQNAHVECSGDVEILDADMGSEIICSGKILATSGRGRLRGGTYSATKGIRANEIGSELGAVTLVAVGVNELAERAKAQLKRELEGIKVQLRRLKAKPCKGPGTAEGKEAKARRELEKLSQDLRQKMLEMDPVEDVVEASDIVAKKCVYFGSQITIRGVSLRPSETTGGRRFALDPETNRVQAKSK